MARRTALAFALVAGSVTLLAAWWWASRPRDEVAVENGSSASSQRVAELEDLVRRRDAELDELRGSLARLETSLAEQREAAQRSTALVEEPAVPALVPEVSQAPSADLDAAAELLRELFPDEFGALTAAGAREITNLDLRGKAITDGDLALLAQLPSLKSLGLRGTAITDAGLAYLSASPQLASIDLRGTQVSGDGFASLPTQRLQELHLTQTKVTGDDLRRMPLMPSLQVLKLNDLDVKDHDLRNLPLLPSLKHLELDGTSIGADGVRGLLADNPNVRRIELRRTPIGDAEFAALHRDFPGVEFVQDVPLAYQDLRGR